MKVTKWVEFEKEVEIEIGADDVVSALYEVSDPSYTPERQCIRALNALVDVFKKMPQEGVDALSSNARGLVRTFLQEQFERFKEK